MRKGCMGSLCPRTVHRRRGGWCSGSRCSCCRCRGRRCRPCCGSAGRSPDHPPQPHRAPPLLHWQINNQNYFCQETVQLLKAEERLYNVVFIFCLKYGVRSPKFIWAPVYSCTLWLRPPNPPPAFGLICEGASGQPKKK